MAETKMSDIIRASVDGIRSFTNMDTVIGEAINTPSGVTVIPVSKVYMGIATGGVDYGTKKNANPQNFGGGGGTGLAITPVAFLTIDKNAEVNLINIESGESDITKIASLIEHSPDIIEKIRAALS